MTDDQIDALDTFALHAMAPRGRQSVRDFARAVLATASEAAKPVGWMSPIEFKNLGIARECNDNRGFIIRPSQLPDYIPTVPLYTTLPTTTSQAGRDAVEARPETPTLAYSLDKERYTEDLDDIMTQLADAESLVEGVTYHVGEVVRHKASDFTEGSSDAIIEQACEAACEVAGEWADNFAYPVAQALRDDLDRVVGEWADKNLPVTFWTVTNVREVEVTAGDVRDYGPTPDAALSTPTGRAAE